MGGKAAAMLNSIMQTPCTDCMYSITRAWLKAALVCELRIAGYYPVSKFLTGDPPAGFRSLLLLNPNNISHNPVSSKVLS